MLFIFFNELSKTKFFIFDFLILFTKSKFKIKTNLWEFKFILNNEEKTLS